MNLNSQSVDVLVDRWVKVEFEDSVTWDRILGAIILVLVVGKSVFNDDDTFIILNWSVVLVGKFQLNE